MTVAHEEPRRQPPEPGQGSARRTARQARCRALCWLLACAVLLFLPLLHPAAAHEIRPIIATVSIGADETFGVELSLNLEAAMAGIGPEHADTSDSPAAPVYDRLRSLPPEALNREFDTFAPSLVENLGISFGNRPARLSVAEVSIPPVGDTGLSRISEIRLTAPLPEGADSFTWHAAPWLGDSVLRLRAPGSGPGSDEIMGATYVAAGQSSGPLTLERARAQPWTEIFIDYLETGFLHILPKGLDHILFVVGLFLLSTRLSALLWQVTAFTVAHTVTLALGTLGIVSLSPTIVEPLIALSIAWVAIENLVTDRLHAWRPVVVFGFGLLHGLGFAGVLGEIGLTTTHFVTGLVAFNLGVELGQLAVIALCFLAVGWSMQRPYYRQAVTIPASVSIAVIALYWTLERLALV